MSAVNKESSAAKTMKPSCSFGFPGRHQNGASAIYRQDRGYRDNSMFLEKMFNHDDNNAVVFTRPMQLGKTTLFSLADELFSVNKSSNVSSDLRYSPGEGDDRNNWFVLRLDFGVVSADAQIEHDDERSSTWEDICKNIDKATTSAIKHRVMYLLMSNPQLNQKYETVSMGVKILHQQIGTVVSNLSTAVHSLQGRLLILVDEYDQPIREGLLRLLPEHGRNNLYDTVKAKITMLFGSYFAFFRAVKVALEQLDHAKILLTGITPIDILIKEMTGLTVASLTFEQHMADAVGLTDAHVRGMLDKIHEYAPFEQGELELASQKIKYHFNNLGFPGGSSLYHTALVNSLMNRLLKSPSDRADFLHDGVDALPGSLCREPEPIPSSVFKVLQNARNLRRVVNELAERCQVKGYKLNKKLSLEHLLREDIDIGDYLTLLVHLGVVSATGSSTTNPTFAVTSAFYREKLLEPLLRTLRASLETLTSLTTTQDLYAKGEEILVDFVTCISKNNMARLMSWASSDTTDNHILELQFQSQHVVTTTEAHAILKGSAQQTMTPEDIILPPLTGKRTDVTFSSATCVVILELKQVQNAPTPAFITKAHEQLSGYVQTRCAMEDGADKRPVAGFVVVMCDDGAGYVVEKLRNDNS